MGTPAKAKSKKPCKYGARTRDGFCPKKPKAAKKAKKACKYGPRDADGYCPKKPSSYGGEERDPYRSEAREPGRVKIAPRRGAGTAEKLATKAVEQVATSTLRRLAQKAQRNPEQASAAGGAAVALARTSVKKALATGAGRMALGSVALAGIAAYAATTYIIKRVARNKEEKAQQAYEAALAYREARAAARRVVNRDLTPAENRSLGAEFKATLRRLGIPISGV
jgi:hypothetical protein